MPLITNVVPSGDECQPAAVQVSNHDSGREERHSDYEDFGEFNDDFVDSDMEGSILNRPRPKKAVKPPALPQRSEKRASRILESVTIELKSLDGSTGPKEAEQKAQVSDPHELYLSSEEDASLSDDYDSDSLVEFESSPTEQEEAQSTPSSRASSRKSQEVTARLVSFKCVGKPQIVEILLTSSGASQKRQSVCTDSMFPIDSLPKARRPSPLKLYPSALRRLSISSTMSNSTYVSNLPQESANSISTLPPRKSSIASNLSSLITSKKHAFLSSDPFPANEASKMAMPADSESNQNTPTTPKTPISMAAAAWKTSLSRTLSKARKPSMPKLSLAYTAGVVQPRNASKLDLENEEDDLDENDPLKQRQRAAITPQTPHDGPIRYQDIINGAIKAPPPAPPSPTKERKLSLGMRGLSRRKSVRGRSDRYLG